MEFFALPDEFVKKVAFIADAYKRVKGYRPPDIQIICAAISMMFDDIAEGFGHGVCVEVMSDGI